LAAAHSASIERPKQKEHPVLDPQSEQIREVYALYGLAMYQAQCLERQLAMLVAIWNPTVRFTAWDFDDRLAQNFESTFGILVTMFSEKSSTAEKPLLIKLENAVVKRNDLAHCYFWNRAVELNSTGGRGEMIQELNALINLFGSLDAEVTELTRNLMEEKGVAQDVVRKELEKLLSGVEAPYDPKRLRNPVQITAAYEWRIGEEVKCGIIFHSDAGNLLLGEKGLCFGPQQIPTEQLKPRAEFAKALPATVKPKPKKAGSWTYMIPLANSYELRVRPDELNGKPVVRFWLRRKASRPNKEL
jgi:hypothetical protein